MPEWMPALLLTTLLGAGLIGGVFFAFSSFVMAALKRLPSAEGTRAMQWINVTVLNWHFLGAFFGTGVLSLGVAILGARYWGVSGSLPMVVGGVSYVLGTFGVTVACNVPRNEALAKLEAGTSEADALWQQYLVQWTFWNHVRTVAALLACGCLGWALWQLEG